MLWDDLIGQFLFFCLYGNQILLKFVASIMELLLQLLTDVEQSDTKVTWGGGH